MATRNLKATNDLASDFLNKLRDQADGPGQAPYIDGRYLAGTLSLTTQRIAGVITPGTTEDDAGDTIANTDDVVINCGFVPLLLLAHDGTAGTLYANTSGQASADTLEVGAGAKVDVLEFGTGADAQTFTIKAAGLTGTNPLTFLALG